MNCPECNRLLKRIAHIIIESPIGHPLDKSGIRKKEVKILGAHDTMYFCSCGYSEEWSVKE